MEERTLICPPLETRRSACVPIPRIIPDSTYGDRPPLQIERDLRGLAPIQEESMQVEPHPANEEDDLGQMYSSKWIRYHLSMAVESTNRRIVEKCHER